MGEYYDSLASRLDAEGYGDDGEGNITGLRDDGSIEIVFPTGDNKVVRPDDSFFYLSSEHAGEEDPGESADEEEAQSEEEYTE